MLPSPVLIVEDDPELQFVLAKILAQEGTQTITTTSTAEALRLAKKYKPRLIVCDFFLSDGTGLDLLIHLRNSKRLSDTRVLIYSSMDEGADAEMCKEAGAFDWLVKGDIQRFKKAVGRALSA